MKGLLVFFLLLVAVAAAPMTATVWIVGVSTEGKGIANNLTVEIQEGKGRVLVTTAPFVGIDTQQSEKTAVEVAQKITGVDLSKKDVIFTIHSDSGTVDGGSAGAAMAAAVVAALEGRKIPPEVMITGTIDDSGTIGPVGSVLAKAKAAADAGAKVFLIPKGQTGQIEYVKVTERAAPDASAERIQAIRVNLTEEAAGWGLQVLEVADINDVMSIMLSNFTGRFEIAKAEREELPNFTISKAEAGVNRIAEKMMARADRLVEEAGDAELKTRLAEARQLYEKGYTYTAANLAFLGAVSAKKKTYTLERLTAEINESVAKAETTIMAVNSSGFYYRDDLENIAAGEQRYVWAKLALEEGSLDSLVVASEWLAAANDIFSELRFTGDTVERKVVDDKAEGAVTDAEDIVSKAVAVGGDTTYAQRSLLFAKESERLGLSPAACFDSVDAIAYGAANSYAGSLARLVNTSKSFDGLATTGWSLGYWKHSVYLRTKAVELDSKATAVDSIVLGLRAYGVESIFKGVDNEFIPLPVTKVVSEVPGKENSREDVLVKISVILFVSLVYATYRLVRAQNALFAIKYPKKLKRRARRKNP